jgi:MGT family glycosyltransferase
MHIALVCPEMHGHLNPMATLGRELAARGHRVSLAGSPRARPKAEACGFELLPVGVAEHDSGQTQRAVDRLAELKGLPALQHTVNMLRDAVVVALRDLPGLLRHARVDAVVVDQVSPAGAAAADVLRLPQVIVCNALALHQEASVPPPLLGWPYRPGILGRVRNRLGNMLLRVVAGDMRRVLNRFRREHRLPPDEPGSYRVGLAHIAQQPDFFDFPRLNLPRHFHYTGPWHNRNRDSETVPFPWEKLDGRPLIYASLGTLQNRLQHVFRAILDGCADQPVQVVLSLGRKDGLWNEPIPPNAVVVPFAPQLTLLERSSLLITHAGLNTALEGLTVGLPMLCIPVTNDQPGVAQRVKWLGAGEILEPSKVTSARVRSLVQLLLKEAKYQETSRKYRERLLSTAPGTTLAANLIEQAFRTGKPVLR